MAENIEQFGVNLPGYLTMGQKSEVLKALSSFPDKINYYTSQFPNDMLQGDGWRGLEVLEFESGARKPRKGIILSNTCDIDPANKRDFPPRIVFAPIIRLSNYEKALVRSGVAAKGIESRFKAIRDQSVSSIFYLAKGGGLDDEFIALLDDVHTMPSAYSPAKKQENKLFTLSQAGFYLFLFKISVHFCRFQEGIHR